MRIWILAAAFLAGCSSSAPPQNFEMPPVPVQTAAVQVRDVPLFIEALGVIKPAKTAEVRPQVSGIIQEIHFSEGQWVEEGALLYSIDDAPYAIRLRELQAQLAQDLTHLENAKKKMQRYQSVSKPDLIAQVDWDELETQIALYGGQVQANEARLAAAKLDVKHCKITAPIAGFAGKSSIGAGNFAAQSTLVTLTQKSPLYVDFSITEKELQLIKETNPPIEVYLPGSDDCIGQGTVSFLDNIIDPKTGQLAASGILHKTHQPLWPGQSVRVHLFFGKKEMAKLIPMRSIKTNQSGPYIFVLKEDSTAEMRSVKLGPEEKGHIVVEEGLDGVDKVITEGHGRLFPGSKVKDAQ